MSKNGPANIHIERCVIATFTALFCLSQTPHFNDRFERLSGKHQFVQCYHLLDGFAVKVISPSSFR
ncbi:hypothetical protein, partial [Bacillus solimangrovi]|uniref:hypothetical protein n=1 Tax=Bacillus solimangrovi TaxID=1305675 RepID=UPI001C30D77A